MATGGERAYAYAKACGILGKSFLARRASVLRNVSRPADLDRLVFPESPLDLPERELSSRIERRISERAASRIVKIVSIFEKPQPALVRLVRAYETADLKIHLSALASGDREPPPFVDIGRFQTVNFNAYPDLPRMVAGTEYEWIRDIPAASTIVDLHTELDLRYYRALWKEILDLPRHDRAGFEELVAEEIALKNVAWTLRLRTYYAAGGEEIEKRLVDVDRDGKSLASDARAAFSLDLASRDDWRGWKRERLLNPAHPGESWKADPRYFQNEAAKHLYRKARILFRRKPFAVDSTACFIKLMQFEEELLISVAEAVSLGIPAADVARAFEAST